VAISTPSLLDQVRADYLAGNYQAARQALEAWPQLDLETAALLALCWVRQVLIERPPGACIDAPILQAALSAPLAHLRLEADRCFVLGWLHWLTGAPTSAEPLLAAAVEALKGEKTAGEAAYWLARVQVGLRVSDAVARYEALMRGLPASPQGTCWFVGLLWRSGQCDRAEKVWHTVSGNRRVQACDEAALLEARPLLRRGQMGSAERVLHEAHPRGGVAQVERVLLLAWTAAAQNKREEAGALLRQAETGPFPGQALQIWRDLFDLGHPTAPQEPNWPQATGTEAHWVAGQQARCAGQRPQAVSALRAAETAPLLLPFVRYALACLGEEDFAAVLAAQPGNFLAPRCRTHLIGQRFCRHEATPAELLDVLQQAETAGYRPTGADFLRRLALVLKQKPAQVEELRRLVETPDPALRITALRAVLEAAVRRLPPRPALELLLEWAPQAAADDVLRLALGRQLLRLLLRAGLGRNQQILEMAATLLGNDPMLSFVSALLGPADETPARIVSPWQERSFCRTALPSRPDGSGEPSYVKNVPAGVITSPEAPPIVRLWRTALALRSPLEDPVAWRAEVAELRGQARLRGLTQGLLVREAAGRGDAATVAALLAEVEAWQGFSAGPPRFVVEAVRATLGTQPRWQTILARWLQVWDLDLLGPAALPLAIHAGLLPSLSAAVGPPPGVALVNWLLHQAAEALRGDEARQALTWIRQAQEHKLADDQAHLVQAALPELERLARAQLLAEVVQLDPGQPPIAPRLLTGMLDSLESGSGSSVLAAAAQGDLAAARQTLTVLAEQPDLPAPLAHHLALVFHRAAVFLEEQDRPNVADYWRRAWRCWLHVLGPLPASPQRDDHPLFGHLLERHRQRIHQLLARDEIEAARRLWILVQGLPELARSVDAGLGQILEGITARFREELASEVLVRARDAMEQGDIPEGWRAHYEAGLDGLRRFLQLDPDNLRLLTALIETCNDWFLDCYNNEDAPRLWHGVECYTPLADHLVRLIEEDGGRLPALAALAGFFKFRGFVASERDQKIGFYRQALRFNPGDENVKNLLAEIEQAKETSR
jgi:hypothetical protein